MEKRTETLLSDCCSLELEVDVCLYAALVYCLVTYFMLPVTRVREILLFLHLSAFCIKPVSVILNELRGALGSRVCGRKLNFNPLCSIRLLAFGVYLVLMF